MERVIRKIFANGFYEHHGAMILFVFSTFLIYCFYINTLGTVLLKDVREWNLAITIAVVSNPVILLMFFLGAALYMIKAFQFFIRFVKLPANEFLFYSVNAAPVKTQKIMWFTVYVKMLLPLTGYALFACVIGSLYQYYLFPALMIIFLLLGHLLLSWYSYKRLKRPLEAVSVSFVFRIAKKRAKTIPMLYFYQVIDKGKLMFLFTKCLSFGISMAILYMFRDEANQWRPALAIVLVMSVCNVLLVFREYAFNERYLYFLHNLPLSMFYRFSAPVLSYVFLMAAELFWILDTFSFRIASDLLVFWLSLLLLFRGLVYYTGSTIRLFLIVVFAIFNTVFLVILYEVSLYFVPMFFLTGYLLFSFHYRRLKLID